MRHRHARRSLLLLGWLGVGTAVASRAGADEQGAPPGASHTRFSAVGYGGSYRSNIGCGAGQVGVKYAGAAARAEWAEEGVDALDGEGWGARVTAGGQSTHAEIVECDTSSGCPDPAPAPKDFVQGFGQAMGGYGWKHFGFRLGLMVTPGQDWDADGTPSKPVGFPAGELMGRYEWAGLRVGVGLPCLACGNAPAPFAAFDLFALEHGRLSLIAAETGAGLDLRVPVYQGWGLAGGGLLGRQLGHPANVGFFGVSYDPEW